MLTQGTQGENLENQENQGIGNYAAENHAAQTEPPQEPTEDDVGDQQQSFDIEE